ncbi:GLE1-domain-containing protein [Stipitochalara longipes BDJ]|nr:GLE1-domain-containing protein [Stipitochalara longipes BDJ]
MSRPSFPGGTSSPASSNNDPQPPDDSSNDPKMAEYVRRWNERNSEATHAAALAKSKAMHDAVREKAVGTLEIEMLRLETERLRLQRIQTEERVRLETERAMEAIRIREEENKARLIPKPPPRVPTPPPQQPIQQPTPPTSTPAPANPQVSQFTQAPPQAAASNPFQASHKQAPTPIAVPSNPQQPHQPLASNPMQAQSQPKLGAQQQKQIPQPAQAPPTTAALQPKSSSSQAAMGGQGASQNPPPQRILHQSADRYVDIHQTLKRLRASIRQHGGKDPQFKKATGDMRRTITRSVGQLTEGRGTNKAQLQTICAQLDASLNMPIAPQFEQNLLFPPQLVMTITPAPSAEENVPNNGDAMPALTIYLLNILAKASISQFCSEAGANPNAADPIGTILVSVFANPKYCFRGKSLIEILIAKFRVLCPVLFGIRGNDKTEEGRARLGWKKDVNGNWISEQEHNDRMTGLGAGFASICLRDFSKSRMRNPWPAHHYWFALASISSTPPDETSSTQFVVLKALIDNYTTTFLRVFGDMGVRALHVVLEEFPRKAPQGNVAASSLQVLAAKLRRDTGLMLTVS